MRSKRKSYSAEFNAKVALEAIRGELTANQIANQGTVQNDVVGEFSRPAKLSQKRWGH